MKARNNMWLAKALLPILAAFSLTGCWNPFSKAEEPAAAVQSPVPPQAKADPITQLQTKLASREAIGLNLEYVVRVSGPAMRIMGNQQLFDLQGCKFTLTTDEAKQSIQGVQLELSKECPVDVGPLINADKPILAGDLTFGAADKYFRPGDYLSDCLSSCGNAYDPSVYWSAEGSRADGFVKVVLSVPIAEDAVVEAAARWRDAMLKSEKEDWVVIETGFNCAPEKYREVAAHEFSGMRPAFLSFGHSVEAPTCTEAAPVAAPAPVSNGMVSIPTPRSDCDMEYAALLKSKGLIAKEKSIHGPDDSDFAGYGCPYRINPAPGTAVKPGTQVTFRAAWESS
ncbi:hypothetical protein [Diaphorobacter caeni]|uniref:hypothetical protein n=1 Tax=Diaphorobacter caeni TaxID=2784387 RepID=UPI00188EA2D7|nr:hypothetical protein [Diaphorobacter caeni]MBF5007229.1 hypothetical protein [Diaphorobacter caeni]